DGRIFTGAQALRLSLVDELGDSQRGLALAARLGGITGKPEVIRDVDSLSDMISLLDSRMSSLLSSETALALRLSDQIGFSGLEYRWRH
ncbi:MAG: signal peptide peptidase SppA, partial [Elusimicrobiota bacterium]